MDMGFLGKIWGKKLMNSRFLGSFR